MRKIFEIKHLDPRETNHTSYADHLAAFNKGVQESLASQLEDLLRDLPSNFAVATVGSDARLEKGPVSPIELAVYKTGSRDIAEVMKRIEDHMRYGDGLELFDEDVEVKDVRTDHMYLTTIRKNGKDIELVSPNRVFDAWFLYGNELLFDNARFKLGTELKSSDPGRSIKERIVRTTKSHAKVARTGKQKFRGQEVTHYDLEEGTAHYDPDNNVWGFKQGPLRLVQYALVRDKIKAIRNHPGRIERILNTSRNTVGALHDFSIRGDLNLSAETASELGDHYKFFLWQYHNSQQRYEREGQTVSTFDPADAKKRSDSLVKICSSQLIV